MSEKKMKKNLRWIGGSPVQANVANSGVLNEFLKLTPTDSGRQKLDQIRNSKAKVRTSPKVQADDRVLENGINGLNSQVNTKDLQKKIELAIEFVKNGKFGKAKAVFTTDDIKVILSWDNADEEHPMNKDQNSVLNGILRLAKSFREYSNKDLMSDAQYDAILAVYLESGEAEPTGIVPRSEAGGAKKVDITYPTLHNNMDKAYAIYLNDPIPEGVKEKDSIEKFLVRVYKDLKLPTTAELELELSPKVDGVSVNGTIIGNILHSPQTRGDESKSVAVNGLDNLQVTNIKNNEHQFGIQYEMFVTEPDRLKLSDTLGMAEPYVSCRHAASGLLSRLANDPYSDNLLEYVSLFPIMAEGLEGTYSEVVDYIQNFGIVPKDMPDRKTIKGDMNTLLKKIRKNFDKLSELRDELSFAIDGMVITLTDDDYQTIVGRDGRTNKYQIALKFDPANAVAYAKGVWLDTGSKGYRTIQVDLNHPVYIDGVRYDHVPVLSKNLYDDLDLRENSKINVHRVGDVIPGISMLERGNGKKLELPMVCPDCGGYLSVKAKKLYCPNRICSGNIIGRMTNFLSKIGVEDYGKSFVEQMYHDDSLKIRSIADLYTEATKDAFAKAGFNGKRAKEFHDVLTKLTEKKTDVALIGAIGIPGVGEAKAKLVLQTYPISFWTKLTTIGAAVHRSEVEGFFKKVVGEQTYEAAADYVLSSQFRKDLLAMSPYIKKFVDFSITDRKVVGHTGFERNTDVDELIEKLGFEYTDGKKFDILIAASKESNSGKMQRAKEKDLPIFTIEEFLESYGE